MITWHFYLLEHMRRCLLFFLLTEPVMEGTEPCAWRGVIWWWWWWWMGVLEVTTLLLAGAGGTNTDSWSVSFAPCLELAASCRVAQHPAGCCGDPSAVARPAHKCPHAPCPSRAIRPDDHKPPCPGHACCPQYHMTVLILS